MGEAAHDRGIGRRGVGVMAPLPAGAEERAGQGGHDRSVIIKFNMTSSTNDRHAGIFMHVTGTRNGRSLDVEMAEAITFDDDGRWQEFWSLAEDQATIDEFWR